MSLPRLRFREGAHPPQGLVRGPFALDATAITIPSSEHMPCCALCLEEQALQNSHIVPEFLYRPAYDDKQAVG